MSSNRIPIRLFALCALVCSVCLSCRRSTYTVDGTFTAPDGTQVYLIDLDAGDTLGTTTVQDGRFTFSGKLQKPVYAYVGRERTRVRFILEPGNVTANIDERTEYGTPLVDGYNAFHSRFYGFDTMRNAERKALQGRRDGLSDKKFNVLWDSLNAVYIRLQAALADSVFSANRDNLLGAMALDDLASKDADLFMSLYDKAGPAVRNSSLVRDDHERLVKKNATAPGKMFTDYTVPGGNPDGTDVKLSDYVGRGKYILLDHWASWCGPCKAEMPYLKKTWEAFRGDRFDIVSIAVSDKRSDTENALKSLDMPWNQILDGQKIPVEVYSVTAIPHLILFDPNGTILRRDLRGEQIYTAISEILSEN